MLCVFSRWILYDNPNPILNPNPNFNPNPNLNPNNNNNNKLSTRQPRAKRVANRVGSWTGLIDWLSAQTSLLFDRANSKPIKREVIDQHWRASNWFHPLHSISMPLLFYLLEPQSHRSNAGQLCNNPMEQEALPSTSISALKIGVLLTRSTSWPKFCLPHNAFEGIEVFG